MQFGKTLLILAVPCAVLSTFTGCDDGGRALVPVTGTVTLNGKPIQGAEIQFMVKGGAAARGVTDEQGRFALKTYEKEGCAVGKAQVLVQKQTFHYDATGNGITTYIIPQRYGIIGRSGLDREVASGDENDFTFELKSP